MSLDIEGNLYSIGDLIKLDLFLTGGKYAHSLKLSGMHPSVTILLGRFLVMEMLRDFNTSSLRKSLLLSVRFS